jgi:hypothetical protein
MQYGHLPYSFVADVNRRWMKPKTYNGLNDALDNWMTFYRQVVWALLFMVRGFSSESFLYEAAGMIKKKGKPTLEHFFPDHDPSGITPCKQVEKMLPRFRDKINFESSGMNPWHIEAFDLPGEVVLRINEILIQPNTFYS